MKPLLTTIAFVCAAQTANAQTFEIMDKANFSPDTKRAVGVAQYNFMPDERDAASIPVSFAGKADLPFNISLSPQFISREADGMSRENFGGRIYVSSTDMTDAKLDADHGWSLFIASDGEKVLLAPNRFNLAAPRAGMQYSEEADIGEFQAGMSLKRSGTLYTHGYVQTDITTENSRGDKVSNDYSFGGITISRKF